MEGGIVLHQIAGVSLDVYGLGRTANLQRDLQQDGNRRVYVHILRVADEPCSGHHEVVVVGWYVGETEIPGSIGRCGSAILADRILDLYRHAGHDCTRWVGDGAID